MGKKNIIFLMGFGLFVLLACNNKSNITADNADSSMTADSGMHNSMDMMKAHADISATKADTAGSGSADFTTTADDKVEMKLMINFPIKANQSVAVHIHEHGDCGDDGKGAHGHWNPTNEKHGKWDSAAYHSGDIGNVMLDAAGKGEITLSSDRWTIGGDEKTNILNRAIIVHSGVDDFTTQPTGNAGSRIGCGVISEVK
ncbi:MAG: superoxide dismutase family protein [Sphingobacteriaceae bacterium]